MNPELRFKVFCHGFICYAILLHGGRINLQFCYSQSKCYSMYRDFSSKFSFSYLGEGFSINITHYVRC